MKVDKILVIGFIGIVLITSSNLFLNEAYGPNKSEKFVQQNNFTITEVKKGLMEIDGRSSSGFVGNGTMLVDLEFENGSKVSYNDVKRLGTDFGRGLVQNNDVIEPTLSGGIVDNGFVQNNNITLSGGGIVDNGFVQNNLVSGVLNNSG